MGTPVRSSKSASNNRSAKSWKYKFNPPIHPNATAHSAARAGPGARSNAFQLQSASGSRKMQRFW